MNMKNKRILGVLFLKGQSVNPKTAGIIGRFGPQNKQPFMVVFFKATEIHIRSARSAGGKQKNQSRSKSSKGQDSLRATGLTGRQILCSHL